MTQPRAMVDVVRPERRAEHPHHQVILFVGALRRGETGERVTAALALQARKLLRDELHRLLPGRLAERLVPRRRGGHSVANVEVHPLEHREVADGLADGPGRAGRLGLLALALGGLPRAPAPIASRPPAPDPPAALLLPAFANQRPGEAVVVLREVVPEPALDAGRALVGRIELDVRRGDAHHLVARHVEVHLAAHAAIRADRADRPLWMADLLGREPLARHDLEDRARGTDTDAFAAPGAARLVRVAVGTYDDLGVLSPLANVEHADDLDVLARAHTPGAEDTGAHVVLNHGVARTLVPVTQRQVPL